MIKTFCRSIIHFKFGSRLLATQSFTFANQQKSSSGQKKIELYKKIKERQTGAAKSNTLSEQSRQKYYKHHRCDGCNSLLQSQHKDKYGYISDDVLKKAVEGNIKLIESSYGAKVQNSDGKALQIVQEVERQLGVNIFNNASKKLDNLDNVGVLLRLQQRIDEYEQSEQTIKRSKKQRQQIYCYRCYTLKYHNKLPEEYNVPQSLTDNNQQQIMGKVFKKHKDVPVVYLYVVDILDIAGSFQKYVFDRLMNEKSETIVILNKLDIANQKYLNKHLILQSVRTLMLDFVKDREKSKMEELRQRITNMKVFLTSNVSKMGIKGLQEYLQKTQINRIQLVGFPNTGKTTLLNELTKLNRPTSKVPGTTLYITESKYQKKLIYDMPGMYSECNLYNLINKPNLKSLLAWNKFFSPPIMLHQALFFGGRIEIKDAKIILFGLGGSCSSDNKWFILNYKSFWKGLPPLHQLQITKHQFDVKFKDGKAKDIEIAGWGFIGLRLATASKAEQTRKLTLYLPKNILFRFRQSVLSDSQIFKFKSNVVKRSRIERIHEQKGSKQPQKKRPVLT